MIVLGIDPGTAACGYGLVEQTAGRLRLIEFGCFTTSPSRSLPERLESIHAALSDLIAMHRPDVMGVERLFFSKNAQTAFAVGQARGVVLLAAAQNRLPIREGTPNEVKLAIAGDGAADKVAVQRMVQLVLSLPGPPAPDDAADALAVAIWALNQAPIAAGAMLDRAAIAPMAAGPTPYERAVREALVRERGASRG